MMTRLQTGFVCWSPHACQWHSIVSNLLPSGGHMVVMCKGLGWEQPQRVCCSSQTWKQSSHSRATLRWWPQHASASSGQGLVWQPHCALYLSPKYQVDKRLNSCMRSSWPSGTSVQAPDEGWNSSLPQWTHPRWWALEDPHHAISVKLDNDQLREVLEAIQFKTARREWATPPHGSPWVNTWIPGGSGETSMVYQGSGPWRGEGMAWTVELACSSLTSSPWANADIQPPP